MPVESPIFVEGWLCGSATVSAKEPLPRDAGERLEKFAELVATAISNAEDNSQLAASRRRIVVASDVRGAESTETFTTASSSGWSRADWPFGRPKRVSLG